MRKETNITIDAILQVLANNKCKDSYIPPYSKFKDCDGQLYTLERLYSVSVGYICRYAPWKALEESIQICNIIKPENDGKRYYCRNDNTTYTYIHSDGVGLLEDVDTGEDITEVYCLGSILSFDFVALDKEI